MPPKTPRPKKNKRTAPDKHPTRTTTVAQTDASARNLRETIESIVIAFVLAFLFRTFEAEAFVIPTGSMAPTLRGRHKDVYCPKCTFRYQSSASDEEGKEAKEARAAFKAAENQNDREMALNAIANHQIVSATCPMCRYTMSVDPSPDPNQWEAGEAELGKEQVSYNGDRILVTKYAYELNDPQRWDIVVFKFPGQANINYIKRLVGLPEEEIRVYRGDIYVRKGDGPFEIERKPPNATRALMQLVHDSHYDPRELVEKNWPLRWHALGDVWKVVEAEESEGNLRQSFVIDGNSQNTEWIRYYHFVPTYSDWQALRQRPLSSHEKASVRPQLITDFYSYNTSRKRIEANRAGPASGPGPSSGKLGLHWVGDLMVDCEVTVEGKSGEVSLELIEGGQPFQCHIDVATGRAQLTIPGLDDYTPTATTALSRPGSYRLALANVDDQLSLWVKRSKDWKWTHIVFDRPTSFDAESVYGGTNQVRPRSDPDDPGDLAPAGIGSQGVAMRVNRMRIYRDVYYITGNGAPSRYENRISDYSSTNTSFADTPENLARFLSDPSQWDVFATMKPGDFELGKDQFFVLGDNSPFSKDGRLWHDDPHYVPHYVERRLLIGKALFVYWPHSWERIPGTKIPFPLFPNFGDMGLVR